MKKVMTGATAAFQDWRGDPIPLRSFTDLRDLALLIGGHDPAQHPQC